MNVAKSVNDMTSKALHHLGINRNDYKQEIDKMVNDTANEILNATKKGRVKGAGLTVLAGGPNVLAGGKKKTTKAPKAKKPRSAKQLKRDKLLKWCRGKGMTMKQSNEFIKKNDLMNKDIQL